MLRISICIATCKRPNSLNRLLKSLSELCFKKSQVPDIKIVIVDNDINGSALGIAEKWKNCHAFPLVYDIEPQRGIPFARNKLVSLSNDSDLIAFIDDDEIADSYWLDELLSIRTETKPDIVTGPVYFRYENEPPDWVLKGKFFKPLYHPEGHLLKSSATNNMLIDRKLLSKIEGPFDVRILTGMDDNILTRRLNLELNAKIVWTNKAKVIEYIPESRLTYKYLAMHGFRIGNSLVQSDRMTISDSHWWVLSRSIKGIGRIMQGFCMLLTFGLFRHDKRVWAIRYIFHGFGTLAGIININYYEYKNIHGN